MIQSVLGNYVQNVGCIMTDDMGLNPVNKLKNIYIVVWYAFFMILTQTIQILYHLKIN